MNSIDSFIIEIMFSFYHKYHTNWQFLLFKIVKSIILNINMFLKINCYNYCNNKNLVDLKNIFPPFY